jgi:uncharacterized repeat protein (TIGR01451 family)
MKFLAISTLLTLALLLSGGRPVAAQYYQPGEDKYELVIDKLIKFNDNFIDNVSASQKVFVNGESVDFKIKIYNSGNIDLYDIQVEDKLPKYLSVMYHPGSLDKANFKITWTIDKLVAGETKEYFIKARVSDYSLMTEIDQINFVDAKNNSVYDSDKAAYVIGGKQMPVTGSFSLLFGSVLSLTMLGGGIGFRKYSRGY